MSSGRDLSAFEDGLQAWLMGDDRPEVEMEAEAAGAIVAEVVLMARKWLRAQFEQKG